MSTKLGVYGGPFTALSSGSTGTYILIGGVWKNVSEVYILISGNWKLVSETNILISSNWKVTVN